MGENLKNETGIKIEIIVWTLYVDQYAQIIVLLLSFFYNFRSAGPNQGRPCEGVDRHVVFLFLGIWQIHYLFLLGKNGSHGVCICECARGRPHIASGFLDL